MKILVAIANYGHGNDRFLQQLLALYRASRFQVQIVVLSDVPKDLGADVEVRVGLPLPQGWSLPFAHRSLFAERAREYDVFIYSEDDTPLTDDHIQAFLDADAVLEEDEIPGFLRYEVDTAGERRFECIHGSYRFLPETVRVRGGRCFAKFSNEHSACSVMTARHLERAIASGGFLVAPHEGRYDLLCAGGNDIYTQCGLTRLICVSDLERFSLHHLPNKYIGVFGIAERELLLQAAELQRIARDGGWRGALYDPETKVPSGTWSKDLYAEPQAPLVALVPERARQILVVGAGSGAAELPLLKRAERVVALPVDAVVGQGVAWRGMEALYASAEDALSALRGETFDCVVFPWVLQLVPDPANWVARFASCIGPDGSLVLSIPKVGDISLRAAKLAPPPGIEHDARHRRVLASIRRLVQVRAWLRGAGLRIDSVQGFHLAAPLSAGAKTSAGWRAVLGPLLQASGLAVRAVR